MTLAPPPIPPYCTLWGFLKPASDEYITACTNLDCPAHPNGDTLTGWVPVSGTYQDGDR